MGYSFEKWSLYKADIKLKDNERRTLRFFSRRTPKRGIPCDLPKEFTVCVNKRTGLPYLKRREDF
jgi:hypothetical protein